MPSSFTNTTGLHICFAFFFVSCVMTSRAVTAFQTSLVRTAQGPQHASCSSLFLRLGTTTRYSSSSFGDRLVLWGNNKALEQEVDPGTVKGTDLRIVKYPHPSLRRPNELVTEDELKDGSIAKLAKEMLLIMYAAQGVGLAAPQVGVNKRLMVYNELGDAKKWLSEMILVNPRIIEYSEAKTTETEGCLSFPDMQGDVERSKWIKVEAMNLKGKKIKKKFSNWEARIFQHEYDHLDGTVYIDRLTEEGRAKVQPRLDELVQEFDDGEPAL